MTSFDIAKFQASIDASCNYTGRGLDFLTKTTWVARDDFDVLYDNACYAPVICEVVGRVSSNRMFIEPHGDFSPPGKLEDASLRFSLVEPHVQYPHLREDFQVSFDSLKTLVNTLCDDAISDSFLSEHRGKPQLTFAQPIFTKTTIDPGEFLPRDAARLPIRSALRSYLMPLAGKYQYNHIRVFSSLEPTRTTPIWIYKRMFHRSLVQVNFNLHYCPERVQRQRLGGQDLGTGFQGIG
ncbi:hypothetical protein BJ912DRAFT_929190 [Pholiota molesta]|nr:hypothetical protein BJ912DRAFT_929190 [Pholiota molesta]